MLTRRQFLYASLATVASGSAIGLYTWQVEPHWLQVVHRPLAIPLLPKELAEKRLVQLSDLHVGAQVADSYIFDTFQRVKALRPDIVVYTGDYTTFHPGVFVQAEQIYADLPKGTLGTVGILGNHDYGPNWAHPEFAGRMAAMLRERGLQILRNEITEIAGLQIAGLDDLWGGRFYPEYAFAAADPNRAILALSHNPDTVDLPGWQRFRGWILSGHTHGGQCKAPFLPPPMLPVQNRRYTSGEFALSDDRKMYISRGVGHLLQVRFNVRPEVTVFELESA